MTVSRWTRHYDASSRDRRHGHADEHEALLAAAIMPGRTGGGFRRLLGQVRWRAVEPGTILLTEGQPVPELLFVTDGAARIERGGSLVAICSRGDFVVEMSFVSGDVATATVIADRPMRLASFDAAALRASLAGDKDLRVGLEASFNRNLIGKLTRSGAPLPAPQA